MGSVVSATKADASPGAVPKALEGSAAKGRDTVKAGLGSVGFDAAEAALMPPENTKAAGGKAPTTKLTAKQTEARTDGYDELRQRGSSPAWMRALQTALGVDATGIANYATVDAIIKRNNNVKTKHPGRLTKAFIKGLEAESPELANTPEQEKTDKLTKAGGGHVEKARGTDVAENEALGMSYGTYASTVLKSGRFLGQSVVLHPTMHARLANATAYLREKYGGADPAVIGDKLGIKTTSSFRASTPDNDESHHGTGFALDLNPASNKWLFSGRTKEVALSYAMERVAELFADPSIAKGADLTKNAKSMETAELFGEMAKANENFKRYRALAQDPAAFAAYFESDRCPAKAKARGLGWWQTKMAKDEKNLAKNLQDPNGKPSKEGGFMDMQQETVTALRDVAGLRWGGSDLGKDNGDLMHFDGHNISEANKMRSKIKAVRAKRKASNVDGA